MPKASWENLDDFLQPQDGGGFAVPATLRTEAVTPPAPGWKPQPTPEGWQEGDPITFTKEGVMGLFDDPYLDAQLGEYVADTSDPRFTCKASDVMGVRRGDWITIDGTTYNVMAKPQNDGTGMVILRLEP
jgi:hypothetical protein